MEFIRKPGLGIGIEIPSYRISSKLVERVERIYGVALGLRHLLPVLVKNVTKDNDISVRRLVEKNG